MASPHMLHLTVACLPPLCRVRYVKMNIIIIIIIIIVIIIIIIIIIITLL
jgi:hypothetical protein